MHSHTLSWGQWQAHVQVDPVFLRKLEKAVAVSGVCSGVPEENSGKVPGQLLENVSGPRNDTNSRISGTRKGKLAGNLGSILPGPCPRLACGVFFEIDKFQPSQVLFFYYFLALAMDKLIKMRDVLSATATTFSTSFCSQSEIVIH